METRLRSLTRSRDRRRRALRPDKDDRVVRRLDTSHRITVRLGKPRGLPRFFGSKSVAGSTVEVSGHRLEGRSRPHARQERQASSVVDLWRADRDQKSPVRRCFKSRSPVQTGFAGSPPAAGFSSAVDRPLVRIPADRHTTTGTCDLGKRRNRRRVPVSQAVFCPAAHFFPSRRPAAGGVRRSQVNILIFLPSSEKPGPSGAPRLRCGAKLAYRSVARRARLRQFVR